MKKTDQGFTLVEILVVIALIGLVTTFVIPSLSGFFKISLGSVTREFAGAVREAYNATVMTGKVHRMVYDLKNQQYWVEQGPAKVALDTAQSREKDERKKRLFKTTSEKSSTPTFTLARSITRKKKDLPRGVMFEEVFTEQSDKPIKDGLAYTHFFPHGISEKTTIHLKDNSEHKISLTLSPLIGKTKVEDGFVPPETAVLK